MFATLCAKLLVKHGWPIKAEIVSPDCFFLFHIDHPHQLPDDALAAVNSAVSILAGTYRVDITQNNGAVMFNRPYSVTKGRHFKEMPHND